MRCRRLRSRFRCEHELRRDYLPLLRLRKGPVLDLAVFAAPDDDGSDVGRYACHSHGRRKGTGEAADNGAILICELPAVMLAVKLKSVASREGGDGPMDGMTRSTAVGETQIRIREG
jgi:hypothetical protein